jgi:hypothetical protein
MWLYTFKSQFVIVIRKKKKSGHQGCDYKGVLLYSIKGDNFLNIFWV